MTRFESEIASAVKNAHDGHVCMTLKLKTKEDFTYTLSQYNLVQEKEQTQKQFFDHLKGFAELNMGAVRETVVNGRAIWTQHEGRMIASDNVKEVWITFDTYSSPEIPLEG